MNYTELELGGKKRGAKLGIGFLKAVTEEMKISLEELVQKLQNPGMDAIFLISQLIYVSLAYNCKRKKEDVDFDQDDVFDWIDDAGGVNSDIYKTFTASLTGSLGADLGKEKPQKKVAK